MGSDIPISAPKAAGGMFYSCVAHPKSKRTEIQCVLFCSATHLPHTYPTPVSYTHLSLDVCGLCGCELNGPGQFVVDEGHVRCPSCRAEAGPVRYGVELSADGLDLLRHVQQELPSGWHAEELPPADRRACSRVIDGFVQYHLGLAWGGGFFRRV